jgi:hypothetical protein
VVEPQATRAGIRVETALRTGDPVDEILAHADVTGAELVAVGSDGAGPIERVLVGSVATAVLRRATCSVLACPRPPYADRERIERAFDGTVESIDAARWASTLDAFTRRNAGRPVTLEVDDPAVGAQGQEFGLAFLGASYNRGDGRVEIVLGDRSDTTHHLTRKVPGVDSVAVWCDADGRERSLRIAHGRGQSLLTFER